MTASKKPSLSLNTARMASSTRKGAHRAAAKGQPMRPPTANQNMPCDVLIPPFQFMKATVPSMTMYMAKLEGRYAVLAWKLPGLRTTAMRKNKPIRWLRVRLMIRHSSVWHSAQAKARTYRTK